MTTTEKKNEELEQLNLIIPMKKIYIISIIAVFFIIFFPFKFLLQEEIIKNDFYSFSHVLFFWLFLAIAIVAHEAIHALVFRIEGATKKEVGFGIKWSTIIPAPYTHCDAELRVATFKRSLLAPFLILGLIPLGIGLIIGSGSVTLFGMAMIAGSVGDLLMFQLICYLPNNKRLKDHPSLAGFIIIKGSSP